MSPHKRQALRERFLAEQQKKLAEDARLADPAVAYRQLLAELAREGERDGAHERERAA